MQAFICIFQASSFNYRIEEEKQGDVEDEIPIEDKEQQDQHIISAYNVVETSPALKKLLGEEVEKGETKNPLGENEKEEEEAKRQEEVREDEQEEEEEQKQVQTREERKRRRKDRRQRKKGKRGGRGGRRKAKEQVLYNFLLMLNTRHASPLHNLTHTSTPHYPTLTSPPSPSATTGTS